MSIYKSDYQCVNLEYTLPQKKRNFSEVAFLLGRSVGQWTLGQIYWPWSRVIMKNLEIKVVFLLGKSVCTSISGHDWWMGNGDEWGLTFFDSSEWGWIGIPIRLNRRKLRISVHRNLIIPPPPPPVAVNNDHSLNPHSSPFPIHPSCPGVSPRIL